MQSVPSPRSWRPLVAVLALLAGVSAQPAFPQSLAAIVNGDPITSTEVDEQIRYRRLIKQPASRPEALEDLIADRLKLRQANREGIDATDASFSQALSQIATKAKTTSNALLSEMQAQKLNIDLMRSHLRAVAAWNDFVKARYKALRVSEAEVDAAMAKDAGLSKSATNYTLQQIIFVLPAGASAATIEQRSREAQALKARFEDCASGIPLARALPDVAIRPPTTKTGSSLTEATRKALAQVRKGKLTSPERTASGIEMVAVCNQSDDADTTSVRDTVQSTLLVDRLQKEADRMYADLRARAVVEKR